MPSSGPQTLPAAGDQGAAPATGRAVSGGHDPDLPSGSTTALNTSRSKGGATLEVLLVGSGGGSRCSSSLRVDLTSSAELDDLGGSLSRGRPGPATSLDRVGDPEVLDPDARLAVQRRPHGGVAELLRIRLWAWWTPSQWYLPAPHASCHVPSAAVRPSCRGRKRRVNHLVTGRLSRRRVAASTPHRHRDPYRRPTPS